MYYPTKRHPKGVTTRHSANREENQARWWRQSWIFQGRTKIQRACNDFTKSSHKYDQICAYIYNGCKQPTTIHYSPKLSLIITLWQSWPSQWKFRFLIIYTWPTLDTTQMNLFVGVQIFSHLWPYGHPNQGWPYMIYYDIWLCPVSPVWQTNPKTPCQ